jgi:hypothetical protein
LLGLYGSADGPANKTEEPLNKNRKVSESKNVSGVFIGYLISSTPSKKFP